MATPKSRNQKGDWIRVAPCLYRYQKNDAYYAVLRRSGKLIRKSLKTTCCLISNDTGGGFGGEEQKGR